ncbi:CBO0543 family protein [Ectobacillus funiculus]
MKTTYEIDLYISLFSTGLTVPEIFIEKYTNLITYVNWKWYYTWLSVYATLFLAWIFYKWFFKLNLNKN